MKPTPDYAAGQMVRIVVGPFQSFTGRIEEVDELNSTVKVLVNIFARREPIELGFTDVEKITFTEE
jgi:transcriptional antiterminator NusG